MNEAPRICPCCGYDLVVDQPIMINDFSMNGAGYPLMWKGEQVKLPPQRAQVCWALMKSYPRKLGILSIYERISDAEDHDNDAIKTNLIRVHISRIRDALEAIGAPDPIQTMKNAYIWNPRAV